MVRQSYYQYLNSDIITGFVQRRCIRSNEWGETVFQCFREETNKLFNQVIVILMNCPVYHCMYF